MTGIDYLDAEVGSSYHSFWIGSEEWSDERGSSHGGLIETAPQRDGIFVDTAVHTGLVPVTVQLIVGPPPEASPDWQDVVRTSITLPTNSIFLIPVGGLGDVSELSLPGSGEFVVQVAGKGRRGVTRDGEADERYLIQVWPTPQWSATEVLRLTSARSQERRRES